MAAIAVPGAAGVGVDPAVAVLEKVLQDYRKKLVEHKELESRLKESKYHRLRVCLFRETRSAKARS